MDVSIYIAKILGLYLLILSSVIFINRSSIRGTISGVIQNPSLQFILGLMIIVFGLILVVSHNVWVNSWEVGITIFGWLILIKGILYAGFPQLIRIMSEPFLGSDRFANIAVVINYLLALYFCYFGFIQ